MIPPILSCEHQRVPSAACQVRLLANAVFIVALMSLLFGLLRASAAPLLIGALGLVAACSVRAGGRDAAG